MVLPGKRIGWVFEATKHGTYKQEIQKLYHLGKPLNLYERGV
jgi:hypothetical protein